MQTKRSPMIRRMKQHVIWREKRLKRECMDCKKFLGYKPGEDGINASICGKCFESKVLVQLREMDNGAV